MPSMTWKFALVVASFAMVNGFYPASRRSMQMLFNFGGKASLAGNTKYTNDVVKVVDGIKHKRLGGGDIVVSEIGLGTQRWVSDDFNAPNEELCNQFLDRAVLNSGVNLIDTAESYPIPSSSKNPEGKVETLIGNWMAKSPGRREKLVIATKITGSANVNPRNIAKDCEGSLGRLKTDYIDVYLLHWPARYSPQSNWGQSLEYNHQAEKYYDGFCSFEDIVSSMGDLIKQGKIRGYGFCNDNAFGLTACSYVAKAMGVPPPVAMQNDYSLINRRIEENGLSEASSGIHLNTGFMAYNTLAGGVLTGKYLEGPPVTTENRSLKDSEQTRKYPRGRHDEVGWGRTLYRYRSAAADAATKEYAQLAKKFDLSLTDLALRFPRERRAVTTTLVGHTSMSQLEASLKSFQNDKRLPEELLWEIDRVHMKNRLPIYSSSRVGKDWFGEGEIGERIP